MAIVEIMMLWQAGGPTGCGRQLKELWLKVNTESWISSPIVAATDNIH